MVETVWQMTDMCYLAAVERATLRWGGDIPGNSAGVIAGKQMLLSIAQHWRNLLLYSGSIHSSLKRQKASFR